MMTKDGTATSSSGFHQLAMRLAHFRELDIWLVGATDQVVGFTIHIARLEGKWKLSQNRSATDQQNVAMTLQQSPDPLSRDVGLLMQQRQATGRA